MAEDDRRQHAGIAGALALHVDGRAVGEADPVRALLGHALDASHRHLPADQRPQVDLEDRGLPADVLGV